MVNIYCKPKSQGDSKMGNLYTVMDELLKVEDELNAFKDISTTLYNSCCSTDKQNTELKAMLCVTVKYITSISTDLKQSINGLDEFIANNATCKALQASACAKDF